MPTSEPLPCPNRKRTTPNRTRLSLAVLTIGIVAGCGCAPSVTPNPPPDDAPAPPAAPMPKPPFDLNTYEGVVADIVSKLDDEGKATLRKTRKDDLSMFHHGWGRNIRNEYQLWSNKVLVESCAKHAGQEEFIHPDDASSIIMKGVWEVVNSRP